MADSDENCKKEIIYFLLTFESYVNQFKLKYY